MRVRFHSDFDWSPHPMQTVAFKQGHELTVTRAVGEAAVKAGAAKLVKAVKRPPAEGDHAEDR